MENGGWDGRLFALTRGSLLIPSISMGPLSSWEWIERQEKMRNEDGDEEKTNEKRLSSVYKSRRRMQRWQPALLACSPSGKDGSPEDNLLLLICRLMRHWENERGWSMTKDSSVPHVSSFGVSSSSFLILMTGQDGPFLESAVPLFQKTREDLQRRIF